MPRPSLPALLYERAGDLTEGQRKVAELLVADPEAIAFGTTTSVAERAGTSGPTVVRFAMRLGYSGFAEMQEELRAEVAQRARSALGRVRQPREQPPALSKISEVDQANVRDTFDRLDPKAFTRLIDLMADFDTRIFFLPSAQCAGVTANFVDNLRVIRDGIHIIRGNELKAVSEMTFVRKKDLFISVDIQRHERSMLKMQRLAVKRGAVPVIVTNKVPCAYDSTRGMIFTFACETAGLFESLVGLQSLLNAINAAMADRLRDQVMPRLEILEAAWAHAGVFES